MAPAAKGQGVGVASQVMFCCATNGWMRPRLAPAGDRIAAVRWHDGAANVWIGTTGAPLRLATDLRPWHLRDYHWGANGRGLILVLGPAGSEASWLAWLDLRSGAMARLTPEHVADAQYVGQVDGDKPTVLIAVRHLDAAGFELQAVASTGAVVAQWQGPGKPVSRWLATGTQALAVCAAANTCTWWHGRLPEPSWSPVAEMPAVDCQVSRPVAFSADGRTLFAKSSVGRDTVALVQMAPPSWAPVVVSASERFDIVSVLASPEGLGPDLVTTTDPGTPQSALSAAAQSDLSRLRQIAAGAPARVLGRNETHCLAEICYPVGGPSYVTFSRATDAASKQMVRYTRLDKVRIQPRDPFTYRAKDGRLITGFLTRPAGPPPWPTVLVIHGGPWSADMAGMDWRTQLLAAAGLCCVQVNFRGSRGFGKEFRDAGDQQWSLAMQEDLVDALRCAPVADVVNPDRIAAFGHGYGGYAALMMATQRDVPLSCVVSASAPTDLVRYVGSLMSSGSASAAEYARRIGHPFDDRRQLIATSPVNRAKQITVPVRLFHGGQDARVPVSHATMFADAVRCNGGRCELTVYPDEGHQYTRPQNIADFGAKCQDFLLRQLGR